MKKLPSFLIIGEAKCGTGTLLYYFDLHPDVSSPKYELNFFNKYYKYVKINLNQKKFNYEI